MGLDDYVKNADMKGLMFGAIMTALAFVAGLFWNDAIRTAIETIIPPSDKLSAKFMAAVIVTILVIIIGYILIKTQKIGEKYGKNIEQTLKAQREDFDAMLKKQKEQFDLQRKAMQEREQRLREELRKGIH
jgi:uncharacterized membrane protein (DUF106 family)